MVGRFRSAIQHKRSEQIDLRHVHRNPVSGEKMIPHAHNGYEHNERDGKGGAAHLTKEDKAMVDRVLSIWEENRQRGVV